MNRLHTLISSHKKELFILWLWLFVSLFNFTKAVHIDDAQYLEVARHITLDPLHPLSGLMNWFDSFEPIHQLLIHPPLIPYMYAGIIGIFGESELAFHLFFSIFTLASIILFYAIAREFSPSYAYLSTVMFFMGPAFLPSQNLMMDVPILSVWLFFFYLLFYAFKKKTPLRYLVLASITIGGATLVKYSGLTLMGVLFIYLFLTRRLKYAWIMIIPLGIVIFWAVFNLFDYGGIHILEMSERKSFAIANILDRSRGWILDLGAILPFTFVFIPFLLKRYRWVGLLGSVLVAVWYAFTYGYFSNQKGEIFFLRILFFANGMLVLWLVLMMGIEYFLRLIMDKHTSEYVRHVILWIWFVGISIYMIVFLSIMAVRHILPVLPALFFLFGAYVFPKVKKNLLIYGCIVNCGLGIILATSDWVFADVYRQYAPIVSAYVRRMPGDNNRQYYFGGHWGWQWYAQKEGFVQYDKWDSQFKDGDILVMPEMEQQIINPIHSRYMFQYDSIEVPFQPLAYIRTMTDPLVAPRGYYATGDEYLPWIVSSEPLENFRIFKVDRNLK